MDTAQPSGFMRLPPEIRCEIYSHLLKIQKRWGAVSPQILRTCRTIYNEAAELLYKLNTVPICIEPKAMCINGKIVYRLSSPSSPVLSFASLKASCGAIGILGLQGEGAELPIIGAKRSPSLQPDGPVLPALVNRCQSIEVYVPLNYHDRQDRDPKTSSTFFRTLNCPLRSVENISWMSYTRKPCLKAQRLPENGITDSRIVDSDVVQWLCTQLSANESLKSVKVMMYCWHLQEVPFPDPDWISHYRSCILDRFRKIRCLKEVSDETRSLYFSDGN